jgi:uncharacterized alkaline shock family protein YloU
MSTKTASHQEQEKGLVNQPFVEDSLENEEELIQISDDVITHIVDLASREIQGVSLVESRSSFSELASYISKGKFIRGKSERDEPRRISVERGQKKGDVKIHISVEMEYGKDMYELAVKLRNHIKDAVEQMTRVHVRKVDVTIVGIRMAESTSAEAPELLAE